MSPTIEPYVLHALQLKPQNQTFWLSWQHDGCCENGSLKIFSPRSVPDLPYSDLWALRPTFMPNLVEIGPQTTAKQRDHHSLCMISERQKSEYHEWCCPMMRYKFPLLSNSMLMCGGHTNTHIEMAQLCLSQHGNGPSYFTNMYCITLNFHDTKISRICPFGHFCTCKTPILQHRGGFQLSVSL